MIHIVLIGKHRLKFLRMLGCSLYGDPKVLRSMDRGDTWIELSGDLTTNPPRAMYRLAPSVH